MQWDGRQSIEDVAAAGNSLCAMIPPARRRADDKRRNAAPKNTTCGAPRQPASRRSHLAAAGRQQSHPLAPCRVRARFAALNVSAETALRGGSSFSRRWLAAQALAQARDGNAPSHWTPRSLLEDRTTLRDFPHRAQVPVVSSRDSEHSKNANTMEPAGDDGRRSTQRSELRIAACGEARSPYDPKPSGNNRLSDTS